jgi:hypothetical protein
MDIEEMMQCLLAKMEPQQIIELLLAIQEDIIASQYEMMMARMEANMDSMKAELISTTKNFNRQHGTILMLGVFFYIQGAVELASGGMIYIPSLIKIGSGIQNFLAGDTHADTDTHRGR